MSENGCDVTRELTAELALGVAAGEERARTVRHLDGCAGCRRDVAELGDLVDALMLLAPEREPPVGFESRVVAAVTGRRRRPRWRRVLAYAVAATLAAAATGVGAYLVTEQDRTVAAQYRTALERAGGRYFGVEFLQESGGGRAGHVFVYRGRPSWAFVVLPPERAGSFHVEVVTREGETLDAGTIDMTAGENGVGVVLPADLAALETIRLLPDGGDAPLEAHLPAPPTD